MELEYWVYSINGKKNRPNEDCYMLLGEHVRLVKQSDRGQLFAVYDGMGGVPRGGEAAQYMCDSLVDFYRKDTGKMTDGAKLLRKLLYEANIDIRRWGTMIGTDGSVGGCVGTVIWLFDGMVNVFHAGDTVCYLLCDDHVTQLTKDHGEGQYVENFFGIGKKRFFRLKRT